MSDLKKFRQETRDWLTENCPEGARGPGQIPFGSRSIELEPDTALWLARMADKGWTVPTWPKQYGGAELDRDQYTILIDEFRKLQPILTEFDYNTKKEILQMHLTFYHQVPQNSL